MRRYSAEYRVSAGTNVYYALDDAERAGIVERIKAERIVGEVQVERLTRGTVFVDDDGHVVASGHRASRRVERTAESRHELSGVPVPAEFLLYLLLPRADRESLLGDLYEELHEIVLPRFGRRRAVVWYWTQVVKSMLPIMAGRFGKLFTWNRIGHAAEAIVRWFSA